MIGAAELNRLDAQQLREVVQSLMGKLTSQHDEIARREREIAFKQATIDKLTHDFPSKYFDHLPGSRRRTSEQRFVGRWAAKALG